MVTTTTPTATLRDDDLSVADIASSYYLWHTKRLGEEIQYEKQEHSTVLLSSHDTQIPIILEQKNRQAESANWESVGTIRDVLKELRKTATASLTEELASFYLSYGKRDPEVRSFTRQIFGVLKDMAFEEGYGGPEMVRESVIELLAEESKSPRDYYEKLLNILAR